MSTDYLFRCVTCPPRESENEYKRYAEYGLDDWRNPETLERLLELRPALQMLGAAIQVQQDRLASLEERTWWQQFPFEFAEQGCAVAVANFFASHTGHEIHVFDEYGRNWTLRDDVCVCGHRLEEHYDWITPERLTCFVHDKTLPGGGKHVCTAHPFVKRDP